MNLLLPRWGAGSVLARHARALENTTVPRRVRLALFGILAIAMVPPFGAVAQPAQAARRRSQRTPSLAPSRLPASGAAVWRHQGRGFCAGVRRRHAAADGRSGHDRVQPRRADLRQHARRARAERPDAVARADGLQRPDLGQYRRHAAKAPGGGRAEALRASGRDHAKREAVRARRNALQVARPSPSRCRIEAAARSTRRLSSL